MMGKKLTKRTVDAMTPSTRDQFIWDSELPGFGCKITPTGLRVYVFQYTKGLRKPRVTIGRHDAPWTPEEARKEALQLKGEVARGGDPAEFRISEKRAPTFAELSTRYVDEHAGSRDVRNSSERGLGQTILRLLCQPGWTRRGQPNRSPVIVQGSIREAERISYSVCREEA